MSTPSGYRPVEDMKDLGNKIMDGTPVAVTGQAVDGAIYEGTFGDNYIFLLRDPDSPRAGLAKLMSIPTTTPSNRAKVDLSKATLLKYYDWNKDDNQENIIERIESYIMSHRLTEVGL